MYTLGFLSLSKDSEEGYFSEIASRATVQGVKCYRFIPTDIDPLTQLVTGRMYSSEIHTWINHTFPVPSIIYDRCFYGDDPHSKKCLPIVTWLKNRHDIAFLGYGLPNKIDLFDTLSKTELAAYLPPSQLVSSSQVVLEKIGQWLSVIIKPINGSQGFGIYLIEKINLKYKVKTEKNGKLIERSFSDKQALSAWLDQLLQNRAYLVQPYLELSDHNNHPFDLRLLLQRNGEGLWETRGKGIRRGQNDGLLSNLSAGGAIIDYKTWAMSLPKINKEYIHNELSYIVSKLPSLLEQSFPPLFELGIDVGIAKNGSIWLLDINSKPGRKVILATNPEISENLFAAPYLYGSHIYENGVQGRNTYNATSLHH